MDAHDTRTAILSLTAPGTSILQGPASITLTRQVNEYAAQLVEQHPSRLGFFAALPPLDATNLSAVVSEAVYALDTLHADGVTLFTRYDGYKYLGHTDFAPLWAELNRRKTVVFVHPTHSVDTNLVNPSLPQPVIDYPHETGRTAVDLIVSGTIQRNPDVKIILSHAGGTLPYLATRAAHLLVDTGLSNISPEEFLDAARSFYFDLALSGNHWSLGLLMKFAKPGHVLYGSDFPYAPTATINKHVQMLDHFVFEDETVQYSVARGAGLAFFQDSSELQGKAKIAKDENVRGCHMASWLDQFDI